MGNAHTSSKHPDRPASCGLLKVLSSSRRRTHLRRYRDAKGAFPTVQEGSFPVWEDGSFTTTTHPRDPHEEESRVYVEQGKKQKQNLRRHNQSPLRKSLQRLKALSPTRPRRRDHDSATAGSEEEYWFFQQLDKDYMPSIQESLWKADDFDGDSVVGIM